MSEDKNKSDVVDRKDYNKIVESRNSLKADLETKEKTLKEMQEKEAKRKMLSEEKKKWKEEMKKKDEQIAELSKKTAEDNSVNKKGIVQEPETKPNTVTTKQMLDERYPNLKVDPANLSPIERMKFFKTPTTRVANSQKFGELLALQASAQETEPHSLPEKFHVAASGDSQVDGERAIDTNQK